MPEIFLAGTANKPTSLSDKIAQLLFVRIGSNMRPSVRVDEDVERVRELLEACPVGGLVVFNGRADTTPEALRTLQEASRFPLLVSTDMERGLGQQFRGATVFPHAFAFDALHDAAEDAIEASAFMAACEALAAGVHISFSPVADVHSNPKNPIISIRSFGSTPDTVSARVEAYIRGCHRAGLLTTAKHFPGHGDTSTDSHDEIPVVSKTYEALQEIEFPPFTAAIAAGADLIMTAHVAFPELDKTGTTATRSGPILTRLLRDKMHFQGAVITDSLLMEGAKSRGESWAAEMIQAGADILLDVPDPAGVHLSIIRAVADGRLSQDRVEEAFERVWVLKNHFLQRFGDDFFRDPSPDFPRSIISAEAHGRLSRDIASQAITISRRPGTDPVVSLRHVQEKGLLFVVIRPHVTYADPTAGSLAEPVRAHFENAEFREIVPDTPPAELEELVRRAPEFGAVVLAAAIKPAAWHRFGLLPEQSRFIREIVRCRPTILAALGSPGLLDEFPEAGLAICTFSDVQVSQQALVQALRILFEAKAEE